jgi:hypothetical protein
MTGLTLVYTLLDGTGRKAHEMSQLVVDAGDYLVLGGVVEELKPSYVDYGYSNGLSAMRNGGARLALECGGTIIDEMEYPDVSASGFDGVSFGLDGNQAPSHLANDEQANLCPATVEFVADNFGSPGESNQPCDIVVPGMCSDGGTMRATVPPQVGDLVITELMSDPTEVMDDVGEWFEVYVARDVDLNGLVAGLVAGSPKNSVASLECVRVTTGDYLVFAKSGEETNGGVVEDFVFDKVSLKNSFGTGPGALYIGIGDTVLDDITYEVSSAGKSLALDPRVTNRDANDNVDNWCAGETPYGLGDLGTPGTENPECPVPPVECEPGQCFDGKACRATVAPEAGQILVNEVLANPNLEGADSAHEWFELAIKGDFDLNGVELGRNETVEQTIPFASCIPVDSGDFVVLAGNQEMTTNGGLPQADLRKTFTLNNDNSNRTVSVGFGGTFFHSLQYNGNLVGTSTQLDPDGDPLSCPTPATEPYGSNSDLGTPGMVNPDCP